MKDLLRWLPRAAILGALITLAAPAAGATKTPVTSAAPTPVGALRGHTRRAHANAASGRAHWLSQRIAISETWAHHRAREVGHEVNAAGHRLSRSAAWVGNKLAASGAWTRDRLAHGLTRFGDAVASLGARLRRAD